MSLDDDLTLEADDETVARLTRLEAIGVRLQETFHPSGQGPRFVALVDDMGAVLVQCVVRLPLVEQVRELLAFYETGILGVSVTRH